MSCADPAAGVPWMAYAHPLLARGLDGWRMAGPGGFRELPDGSIESHGGSGLLWYADEVFEDFILGVEWRIAAATDNSGVFLRCPPLADDPGPAIERGYEVQIDDRGLDPATGQLGSPYHLTGAVYRLAPAATLASRGVGAWNVFEITARGATIDVRLNGTHVARLENADREARGHIALQNHHEGSAVRFRELKIQRLG